MTLIENYSVRGFHTRLTPEFEKWLGSGRFSGKTYFHMGDLSYPPSDVTCCRLNQGFMLVTIPEVCHDLRKLFDDFKRESQNQEIQTPTSTKEIPPQNPTLNSAQEIPSQSPESQTSDAGLGPKAACREVGSHPKAACREVGSHPRAACREVGSHPRAACREVGSHPKAACRDAACRESGTGLKNPESPKTEIQFQPMLAAIGSEKVEMYSVTIVLDGGFHDWINGRAAEGLTWHVEKDVDHADIVKKDGELREVQLHEFNRGSYQYFKRLLTLQEVTALQKSLSFIKDRYIEQTKRLLESLSDSGMNIL